MSRKLDLVIVVVFAFTFPTAKNAQYRDYGRSRKFFLQIKHLFYCKIQNELKALKYSQLFLIIIILSRDFIEPQYF